VAVSLRVYRQRIKSVQAIAKITRAFELIAASRIVKAQQAVVQSEPYARGITQAVSAVASLSNAEHALTREHEKPDRAAMLLITSDRGLAGAYSSSAIREGESLATLLRSEGKTVMPYICGRKGIAYYKFRQREVVDQWSGFSDKPTYADAKQVAQTLIDAFTTPTDEGGVHEIHIVYTEFVSMLTQRPVARRLLPLEYEESTEEPAEGALPLYEFEPSAEAVLDALLPQYIGSRIYNAMLQAAASELASRRRAMKSATDNAEDLVRTLTREANQARQGEITQEISEIVGGANALQDAMSAHE